jgi:hypothetical protein
VITSAQICTLAAQIAKCPGFTSQSGQSLNLVLNDLVLHRNLKMNRIQASIAVQIGSNGPFTLESDYLRTYDLFYTINNFPYFLFPMSQEQFDALFKDPSIANYPYAFTTDLTNQASQTAGNLYIFPQSTSALSLTHRYMINRADISTPESSSTKPWFPDQDYLIHATAMRLMKITDDARYEKFVADGEAMLRTHLIMEGDEQQVVKSIRLDPQRFHMNRTLRPTKLNPY